MSKKTFDSAWRTWLSHNLSRGCSRDELFGILVKEGFDPEVARKEMHRAETTSAIPAAAPIASPMRDVGRGAQFLPDSKRHDSPLLELYTIDDFLDGGTCRKLVELIKAKLRPSTISHTGTADPTFRTSRTCDLHDNDAVVKDLNRKICNALQTAASYTEPAQGQYYEVGQEFKPHTDYFEAYELARFSTDKLGQRSWTFMVYLNEPKLGGETRFVNAGFAVQPKTGRAVIWNNLRPDGEPNPDTLHQGMPVLAGNKAIITKWFRHARKDR